MASASPRRVAVVGAGAVGGYFGGMLARAGADVTLIGRPVHVEVWKRDGLFVDSINFQERIRVAASTDVAAGFSNPLWWWWTADYRWWTPARRSAGPGQSAFLSDSR